MGTFESIICVSCCIILTYGFVSICISHRREMKRQRENHRMWEENHKSWMQGQIAQVKSRQRNKKEESDGS